VFGWNVSSSPEQQRQVGHDSRAWQEVPAAEPGASSLSCLPFLPVGTFTLLHACGNEQAWLMDTRFAFPSVLEHTLTM